MALLLDPPKACPDVSAEQHSLGGDVARLVERWGLDPADFQVRKLELRDAACFAQGQFLVTVTNGRVRASRTYVSRAQADEWFSDFDQDLRAGVFSPPSANAAKAGPASR